MNNNRLKEINNFLTYYKKIYQQNPNLGIHNKDTFYNSLCEYNLRTPWSSISSFHKEFINFFKNTPNIDVFVEEDWRYFCQFVNTDRNLDTDRLKVYISMDKENILEASKELFSFLARKNIKHLSKIGSQVRTDDIVIRLDNFNDYEELKNFISKSKYFKHGKNKPNPFVFSDGIMGYAYDGRLSYNATVSLYLANYFKYVRENNLLNNVSAADFLNYLINIYNKVFKTGELLDDYLKDFNIKSLEYLLNYQQVTKTLILSIQNADKKLDMNMLRQLGNEFNDQTIIANKKEKLTRLLNQNSKRNENYNNSWLRKYGGTVPNNELFNDLNSKVSNLNINNIDKSYYINRWFSYLTDNFSNQSIVKHYINLALDGSINAITRANNLRYIFYKYITPDDIQNEINRLTNNRGLNSLFEKTRKENDNIWTRKINQNLIFELDNMASQIEIPNIDKSFYIGMWFNYLINKFPDINDIKGYVIPTLNGNINSVTRTYDLRYIFYKYITPNDIQDEINRLSNNRGLDYLLNTVLQSNNQTIDTPKKR